MNNNNTMYMNNDTTISTDLLCYKTRQMPFSFSNPRNFTFILKQLYFKRYSKVTLKYTKPIAKIQLAYVPTCFLLRHSEIRIKPLFYYLLTLFCLKRIKLFSLNS